MSTSTNGAATEPLRVTLFRLENKKKHEHTKEWFSASEFVKAWGAEQGVVLRFRHVKGHNVKDGEARSYVNNVCDTIAKNAMRRVRDSAKNDKN